MALKKNARGHALAFLTPPPKSFHHMPNGTTTTYSASPFVGWDKSQQQRQPAPINATISSDHSESW
ncbi:MAG: hypothetical protein NXI22_20335, partial [bacterium]|nr:hypothetical protein [bacterium]